MVCACACPRVSSLAWSSGSRCSKGLAGNVCQLDMKLGQRLSRWGCCRSSKLGGSYFVWKGNLSRVGFEAANAVSFDGQSAQTGGFYSAAEEGSGKSFVWADSKRPRICILGGGFGGLNTALRLDSLAWAPDRRPEVLLIDQSDCFVFKPLLYEILSKEVDEWEIAPTFSDLLSKTSVMFLKDSVRAISPLNSLRGNGYRASANTGSGGTVFLEGGVHVEYDWLVLALGAESRLDIVPEASEFAVPFATLDDALEVDRRLVALERERFGLEGSPIEVVIVGSGYSGIELAATIAERLGESGQVKVVGPSPDICVSAPVGNRQAALKVLASRNVQLETGFFVSSISESAVSRTMSEGNGSPSMQAGWKKLVVDLKLASQRGQRTTGGRQLNADLVLWTIGTKATVPSGLDADHVPFPINGRGQADTDETLRVKGHPQIFAMGDSAGAVDSSGRALPSTAQVAYQQADYVAWNLWAAINNRPLLPFRYQHLGEMMTLGTSDAAVSPGFIDNFTLDGLLGHSARKLAYLIRVPTNDHRAKVALSWLAKSTINSMAFVQGELQKVTSSR